MSQHDPAAQQGSSIVKSFALQLDSDSDAGSVYSNGIDSPPQERRAEEKEPGRADSARRATLAALGLVPGPPPPVSGTPGKPNRGSGTPRNHFVSQQISPPPSSEASPDQSAARKAPGQESPPGAFARLPQSPSQAYAPGQPGSSSKGGFGISPFSKVSENIAGLTKPSAAHTEPSKEQSQMMSSGAPQQQGKQPEGLSESEGADEKPMGAAKLRGHSSLEAHTGSESESSSLTRVPSSPFEAAQSMPIEEQPFVSPVPPIRVKAPSNSPQGSTSRGSSRFQDRYTSPTTTRIVDELLDEVVAQRLTPRDMSGTGRNNEAPMRPRGRSNSGDERDLPRIGKQEGSRVSVRKEFNSFSDAGQATPSASGGSELEASSSKGSAGPQSLSEGREGRSSSIGEELKRVMKSERAGRLARDSAEILVGDRPGEFTVVTQEGSSIPVDVRDLTESSSGKKDPLAVPASHSEPQQLAPMHESTLQGPAADLAPAGLATQEQALAARLGDAEASEAVESASEPAPAAGAEQGSAAKKTTTWLGSMMAAGTAALGLKGGAPADNGSSTRSLQPAEEAAAAEPAAALPSATNSAAPVAQQEAALPGKEGAAEAQEQPPVLNIASTEPKAELSPVSAFASEVAVQPVSAATTDSSPIAGPAAESTSAVASPPVAEVRAPEPEEDANSFADALSLECVQKESSLAGKPLDKTHVAHHPVTLAHEVVKGGGDPSAFKEALGLEELLHRRQPEHVSPMTTAGSNTSDASTDSAGFLGGRRRRRSSFGSTEFIDEGVNDELVADPSHRASIDFSGAAPGSAVEQLIGHLLPKPVGAPKLPTVPEPSDMCSHDLTGSPKGDTVTLSEPVRLAGPGSAPVTAERTRSEAAFLEAMPLMLPQKKKPAPRKPMNSQRSPSDAANAQEALPLEKSRPQSRPSAAAQPQAQASSGPQSPSWEQAVPLEMTRRRPTPVKAPPQPEKAESASASAWEEAAPLERVSKRSSRSSPGASPRTAEPITPSASTPSRSSRRSRAPPANVDITEEAQLQDPSLDRSESLDQKLPLMANLSGMYSLESSGTERYDLYIDRAAAYDKAQQVARRNSRNMNKSGSTKQSSGSLSSAAATPHGSGRRTAHMGGIAAGTQPGSIHGHHEEPDIDMPEPDTPASDESDSDEAEGNNIYYPSKSKGGEKGEGDNSMKELVGVAHVSPPQSAFASAQPPRSVFADAQMPVSDSEAEPDSARSHHRSFDQLGQPKAAQVEDTNNFAGGKAGQKQKANKKKGFCSCFG